MLHDMTHSLVQYTLAEPLTLDKVTVSAWAHTGPSHGHREVAIRMYDLSSNWADQKNSFEFFPAGYIALNDIPKGFMMTAILKGGSPQRSFNPQPT